MALMISVFALVFCVGTLAAQTPIPTTFLLEKIQCPSILDSATRASLFTGTLPKAPIGPNDPILTLAVRLNTASSLLADTTSEVWLDIGPKAWKIGNSFPRGSSQTFLIDLKTPDSAIDIPQVPLLRVRDISVFRLEKKGLCGLTNAPDSNYALGLNDISPTALIAQLQRQAAVAQYFLGEKQSLLAQAQGAFDNANSQLDKARNKIRQAQETLKTGAQRLTDLQQTVDKKQVELATLPLTITREVCHSVRKVKPGLNLKSLACIANPAACFILVQICPVEAIANPAIEKLKSEVNAAITAKSNLAKELADAQITVSTAAAITGPLEAVSGAAKLQLEVARSTTGAAQKAFDIAQKVLEEAKVLVSKLVPGLPLPRVGQWAVESAALIVNGHELYTFTPNVTLRQGNPEWKQSLLKISREDEFVRRTRMTLNRGNNSDRPSIDQLFAGALTVFKEAGFSGWLRSEVGRALAVGVLRNKPSPGTDGIVSLDLELERIEVNGHVFIANKDLGTRYLRAEYAFAANGRNDKRYLDWAVGDRLEITGEAVWDTDRNGFYELHPGRSEEMRKLKPYELGGTGGISIIKRIFSR